MRERKNHLLFVEESSREIARHTGPEHQMLVKLPMEHGFEENTFCRASMHTDMMGSFVRTIGTLKPRVKNGILVQARVLTEKQFNRLKDDRVYEFFYSYRIFRDNMGDRKKIVKLLVPKGTKLNDTQIRGYIKHNFDPSTLSKKYNYQIGWYPAGYLEQLALDDYSYNSLAPFLGAVNQFRIGSDVLGPGIVRMVGIRLMMGFERDSKEVVNSITAKLGWKEIQASSRVIDLR